jgi:hypothetical protein
LGEAQHPAPIASVVSADRIVLDPKDNGDRLVVSVDFESRAG